MCTSLLLFSTTTQGELQMKMLLIVFRDSLEDEIVVLLKEFSVKAFTELHKVGGTGETGDAFYSCAWPGANSMILTGLAEDQAEGVVGGSDSRPVQLSSVGQG